MCYCMTQPPCLRSASSSSISRRSRSLRATSFQSRSVSAPSSAHKRLLLGEQPARFTARKASTEPRAFSFLFETIPAFASIFADCDPRFLRFFIMPNVLILAATLFAVGYSALLLRFFFLMTNFKPDHTSLTAQTLISTRPSGSATSLIVSSVISVGTLDDFFGHETQTAPSDRIFFKQSTSALDNSFYLMRIYGQCRCRWRFVTPF